MLHYPPSPDDDGRPDGHDAGPTYRTDDAYGHGWCDVSRRLWRSAHATDGRDATDAADGRDATDGRTLHGTTLLIMRQEHRNGHIGRGKERCGGGVPRRFLGDIVYVFDENLF